MDFSEYQKQALTTALPTAAPTDLGAQDDDH